MSLKTTRVFAADGNGASRTRLLAPFTTGLVIAAFLILLVAGCGEDTGGSGEPTPSPKTSTPTPSASTPTPPASSTTNVQFFGADDLSGESKSSLADLIADIQAGVVQITTGSGSGSGFIVGADGLVVTNAHVVGSRARVGVWLTSGRRYNGDVLERDTTADLALVQIDGSGRFDAIVVGNPDSVRVGDEVLALGFPLADTIGNSLTVTRGIISSARNTGGVDLWQTDAAINPGNSGGPLVNSDGRVVGVNTSRIEKTDSGRPVQSIGFAVSVIELERRLGALSGRGITKRGTPTPLPTPILTPTPGPTPTRTLTPAPSLTPTFTPTLPSTTIDEYMSGVLAIKPWNRDVSNLETARNVRIKNILAQAVVLGLPSAEWLGYLAENPEPWDRIDWEAAIILLWYDRDERTIAAVGNNLADVLTAVKTSENPFAGEYAERVAQELILRDASANYENYNEAEAAERLLRPTTE